MRINLYFKDNSEKDAVILKMLNDKYSPKDYIKETLYRLAIKAEKDKDIKKSASQTVCFCPLQKLSTDCSNI
ncbi:hypothetical protein [uncultured Clostridium sp.]|uniref:hypothetical protein n=1 Tax=uncultured Clostridium sp. TaxID=59620 RepID=UPI0025FC2037|nr:hypothetical protein [uncultured Clostridium sp.]